MVIQDIKVVCRDCEAEFVFSSELQQDFKKRGFNPPARCAECHQRRTVRRISNRTGEHQTHPATCEECGKETQLKFKPTGVKPVYCEECYQVRLDAEREKISREFVIRKTVKEPITNKKIENLEVDENSLSFLDFNLDSRLQKAIVESEYITPTPVQSATIPMALAGRDLIGTAQTGTGKTAAFALPILEHMIRNPIKKPCTRAIVLTPTRELAEQICDSFKILGRHTKIRCATVYGGVGMGAQEHALRNGVEIIIACPGRLLDHINRGNTNFKGVEKLVLDEADRMLDMGFLPPIKKIMSFLPKERQSMLFSATFAPELDRLVKDHLNDPKKVNIGLSAPAKTVSHALYPVPAHLKTSLVIELLSKTDANSVLIFTRTKHRANRVYEQIERAGYTVAALHSNKSQNQRQQALDSFRSGKCQILVATDIAARGLDVETISHVINYDIPDTSDAYIHRIGRTGRAEREGDAMTFVTGKDTGMVFEIEKSLGSSIERKKLEDFDYKSPAPSTDEFKRSPLPTRKPRVEPKKVMAFVDYGSDTPFRRRTASSSKPGQFAKRGFK